MEIPTKESTDKILQYEILAELGYDRHRDSYWNWSTSKPSHWECRICNAHVEGPDSYIILSHLWNQHGISPVQRGFGWVGRPIG